MVSFIFIFLFLSFFFYFYSYYLIDCNLQRVLKILISVLPSKYSLMTLSQVNTPYPTNATPQFLWKLTPFTYDTTCLFVCLFFFTEVKEVADTADHLAVKAKRIYLVDSGLLFNSPYPPLLRPQRNVDIFLSFDFSAREKDNELSFNVIEQI